MGLIRKHKIDYYNEKIDGCRGDSKEMWKTLKAIIKGNNEVCKNEIIFGNNVLNDEKLICEAFNNFFLDSIDEIVHNIDK